MSTPHLIRSRRLLPALAVVISLASSSCSAIETSARADATRAEAQRLTAKAQADDGAARLTSATAISNTLAIQSTQVQRLTDQVIESARMWQATTMILAGCMCLTLAVIALAILRRPTARPVVYMLPSDRRMPDQVPALPPATSWPEHRALMRACRELATTQQARG